MKNTIRLLTIGLYTLTSILFAQHTLSAAETTRPKLDRVRPENVEHATFSMG